MMHIEQVTIFADGYITGLEVVSKINNKLTVTRNVGRESSKSAAEPKYSETIVLETEEHIDFLSCRYNCDGVYMLTLKTNLGQSIVVEGDAGNEEEDEEEEGEECH